jgi:hypothetical protein
MEVWGLPTENDRGTWQIRIAERHRGQETVVGRFVLEVRGDTPDDKNDADSLG